MSSSSAYPVLRSTDLRAAFAAARRLLALITPMDRFHVNAQARAGTFDEAQRLLAALPGAHVSPEDPTRPESRAELRRMIASGGDLPAGCLPVTVLFDQAAAGSIEDAFIAAIGDAPASVDWDWFLWPSVPALDLGPDGRNSHLRLDINGWPPGSGTASLTGEHVLYVHVRENDVERAQWLAEQVGLRVLGPSEHSW